MRSRLPLRIFLVSLCLLMDACGSSDKHYTLTGKVVSKMLATHTLIVDHDDIPGFMPAMTMPYPVAQGIDLSGVEPGDRIQARIVVESNDKYWLDKISVVDSSHREKAPDESKQLYPGQPIPGVELVNQGGQTIHLSDFRGKALLLTFIYTRCPMPTFCPLLSSHFAAIYRELAKNPQELERTRLLSISIDPKYDTPAVLHKYGLAYLNDDAKGFATWQFAVPSAENLKKLAEAFDLIYEDQDNQIAHSMSTVLIAPDGKLAKEWLTSDWTKDDAIAAIRQVENAPH